MVLSNVFELFVKQSPVAVMVRATLENVLSAERLDALFAEQARRQRPSELLFSLVVDLLGTVVCGVRPSIHAAFQARSEEIGVSVKALYDKLRGIEPHVARELVRDASARMAQIVDAAGGRLPGTPRRCAGRCMPETIDGRQVAELYRRRWTLETAFQELEATLEGELQTLCYPQAALFAFCLALVAYNVLSVVKAALRGECGADAAGKISGYYLADEAAGVWRGMMIVLPANYWQERFADRTPCDMAAFLRRTARHVRLDAFRKHPRGPKKKPPNSMNKKHRTHVSTARILEQRRSQTNTTKKK